MFHLGFYCTCCRLGFMAGVYAESAWGLPGTQTHHAGISQNGCSQKGGRYCMDLYYNLKSDILKEKWCHMLYLIIIPMACGP